jgi:hypothetical protein
MGPDNVKELQNHNANATKVPGSIGPAKSPAKPLHLHSGLVSLRINSPRRGVKDNIHLFSLEQASISLEIARVTGNIFTRPKLRGIYKDRNHEPVPSLSTLADQAEMPLMQEPHGRDQDDASSLEPLFFAPLLHFMNVLHHYHGHTV